MRLLPVSIRSGNLQVSGLQYVPAVQPKELSILLTHGYTAGKYSMDYLASILARKGYTCLTYDLPGHLLGATGGELREYEDALNCTMRCAEWFEGKTSGKLILAGHSLGAALSIHATIQYEKNSKSVLAGLVAMSIGENPFSGFESPLGQSMMQMRESHVAGLQAEQFLKEIDTHINHTNDVIITKSLFLAGEQDFIAPPDRVEALANRICKNSTYKELKTNHLEMPQRSANTILSWLQSLMELQV